MLLQGVPCNCYFNPSNGRILVWHSAVITARQRELREHVSGGQNDSKGTEGRQFQLFTCKPSHHCESATNNSPIWLYEFDL